LTNLFTTQGSGSGQQLPFNQQQNADTDKQAQIQADTVEVLGKTIDLTQKLSDDLHATVLTAENLQQVTDMINDDISNLDDFIRPPKNYFYWEPHCFDIPICWAFRSLFDGLDGIDSLDVEIAHTVTDLQAVDALLPQLTTQLKILRDDTQALQAVVVNTYGPAHLQSTQTDQTFDDLINVGNDFDKSRSDDFFYMPREAFDNEDVKTGMTLMMSPDGKAARFIVTHEGNAMGPEGVEHVEAFPDAIKISLKETSLAGSRIYIGGAGSNNKDIKQYAASDLLIVAIAAFILIFLIMLFITRSLMAALVIPGTVAFSFAGAFGLSVLVWQHLIGLHLHWLVLPITFIILVAVGSDYNLLLIARVKEELGAGIHTGLIRALGSTGGVVTSAGLVFAFTMLAMLTSDLRTIGKVGTTVHRLAPRHADRAFVHRALHPQDSRAMVLVADIGAFSPAAAAVRSRREPMNLSLWALLTAVAFAAVVVFAAIASVFVMRLVRRPTLPMSEEVGGITRVLRKLRKREPMSDEELAVARQAVSDRGSWMALCIPATIFSIGCFYVFGSLEYLHGATPSERTFIGVIPMFTSTNLAIRMLRSASLKGRLQTKPKAPQAALHAPD
jgi:hypothetical protein